jgi:DNA-binding transcriptional MerR regulator
LRPRHCGTTSARAFSSRQPGTDKGYRLYDEQAVRRLEFIRFAQTIGFTLEDMRALLELDAATSCGEVQQLIDRRLVDVDRRLAELNRLRSTLSAALDECHKSKRGCAVLNDLKTPKKKRELP